MAAANENLYNLANEVKPVQDYFKILQYAKFFYFGAFDNIDDFALKSIVDNLHRISLDNN